MKNKTQPLIFFVLLCVFAALSGDPRLSAGARAEASQTCSVKITGPTDICELPPDQPPPIFVLTATFANCPLGTSFKWFDASGNMIGTSNPITPSYPPPGIYTYQIKVFDINGAQIASGSFTVNIHAAPIAGPAAISVAPGLLNWKTAIDVCCGQAWTLKLDPPTNGPIVGSIQWQQALPSKPFTNIPGATGSNTNVNPDPTLCDPSKPVTIKYRAVVSTGKWCPSFFSNIVSVTIYPLPQAGPLTAMPAAICNDGVSSSTVTLAGPIVGTLTWYKQSPCGSGTWTPFTPPGTSPVLSFSTGPLTNSTCYKAEITSGPCPPLPLTTTVTVDQKPVAGVITVAPLIPICAGAAAVLTLSGSSGLVQWFASTNQATVFNNPIVGATNNTVQNTNNLSQTMYYGVQVSSPNGVCPPVNSAIVPVNVTQPPTPPVIVGQTFICIGGTAGLAFQPPLPPPGSTVQWYFNGEAIIGGNAHPLAINVTEPGNYYLEIDNGCFTAQSNVITVKPDLLAVTITGPCCPCQGQPVQLTATPINGTGPYTYQWSNGATTASINFPATTTATYSVTVTDANGCKATTSFTITVCP